MALWKFFNLRILPDDDFSDRLHRLYTPLMLLFCLLLVLLRLAFFTNYECMAPAQFTENHIQYATTMCKQSPNYFLPLDDSIPLPEPKNIRFEKPIYYDYIPFIFPLMALLPLITRAIWREASKFFTNDCLGAVCGALARRDQSANLGDAEREKLLEIAGSKICPAGKSRAGWTCLIAMILYFIIKLLYLLQAFSQLAIIDRIMSPTEHFYGIRVLAEMAPKNGTDEMSMYDDMTNESNLFPMDILCDLKMRSVGRIMHYTLQCHLAINEFYPKLFFFLWWWMVVPILLTSISYFSWALSLLLACLFRGRLEGRLAEAGVEVNNHSQIADLHRKIGFSGYFVLEMVTRNFDESTVALMLQYLWKRETGRTENFGHIVGDIPRKEEARNRPPVRQGPIPTVTHVATPPGPVIYPAM